MTSGSPKTVQKTSGNWFVCALQICCHFTTQNRQTNLKTNGEPNTFLVCLYVFFPQLVLSLRELKIRTNYVYYESMKRKLILNLYMNVGVMKDYKLRDLRVSLTLKDVCMSVGVCLADLDRII
jgi:hypothetical protein